MELAVGREGGMSRLCRVRAWSGDVVVVGLMRLLRMRMGWRSMGEEGRVGTEVWS